MADEYNASHEAAKAAAQAIDLMEHDGISAAVNQISEAIAEAVLLFRDNGADPFVTVAAITSAANGAILNAVLATTEGE